eukprot:14370911-Alexandrium_andersonii.AAC.1
MVPWRQPGPLAPHHCLEVARQQAIKGIQVPVLHDVCSKSRDCSVHDVRQEDLALLLLRRRGDPVAAERGPRGSYCQPPLAQLSVDRPEDREDAAQVPRLGADLADVLG